MFGILPSFEGSLERLGLGADGVRTTPLSGEPDLLRGPSPEADQLLQLGVETTYRRFVGLVSRARGLPLARVNAIGQGRVWDGGTARQLRLVDRFGSLDDAIAEAARRANISVEDARPVYLEREPGFLAQLIRDIATEDNSPEARDAFSRLATRPEAVMERVVFDMQMMLRGSAIQARCLQCPMAAPVPRARTRAPDSLLARLLASVWAVKVRLATADDAAAIARLRYVSATAVSFRPSRPTPGSAAGSSNGDLYPWFIAAAGRVVLGAYACAFRARRLSLQRRDHRLCCWRRPSQGHWRSALCPPAAPPRSAGLHPGDRRDHPAQRG